MSEQISSYRLESEIARGGMGIVYRGVHTVFEEVVAIKAIFPELTLNPELRARFVNEAKIQRRLQHPNIVQIREFLIDHDRFYIVMDLIEGETLADRLRRMGGPLPSNEALEIFRQALRGLGYAHAQGVIHRDMKPSNIMLTREGVAKLTDFGIARAVGVPGLTRTGSVLGTPAYMAPEQIQGRKSDQRADIYSLGVTLYEMVAGRVPFEKPKDSDSAFEVLRAHIEEPPPPPCRFASSLPPFVEAAILKAMAKSPDERFASCQEFEAALAHQELAATRRVVPETAPRSREPAPAVAAGTAALPPASREAARPPVAPRPPEPLRVAKSVAAQLAAAKARPKTKAGYKWVVFVFAAALGVGGYWHYRERPPETPSRSQPLLPPQREQPVTSQSVQPPPQPASHPAAEEQRPKQRYAALVGKWVVQIDCANAWRESPECQPEFLYKKLMAISHGAGEFMAYAEPYHESSVAEIAAGESRVLIEEVVQQLRRDIFLHRAYAFAGPFDSKVQADAWERTNSGSLGGPALTRTFQVANYVGTLEPEETLVGPPRTIEGVLVNAKYGIQNVVFTLETDSHERHEFGVRSPNPKNLPLPENNGERFAVEFKDVSIKRGDKIVRRGTEVVRIKPLGSSTRIQAVTPAGNVASRATGISVSAIGGCYSGTCPSRQGLIDGDTNSIGGFWSGASGSTQGKLELELDQTYAISHIRVYSQYWSPADYGSEGCTKYQVEVSAERQNWTTVRTNAWACRPMRPYGSYAMEEVVFPAQPVKYIKVSITDSSGPRSHIWRTQIAEIEAGDENLPRRSWSR